MKYYARVKDGIVREIKQDEKQPEVHKSITFVDANSAVRVGWVYDGNSFSDPESLKSVQQVKKEKKTAVSSFRDKKYAEGLTYKGNNFQITVAAQKDMISVQMQFQIEQNRLLLNLPASIGFSPHGGYWRDSNNQKVAMNNDQVQAFFQAAYNHVLSIKVSAWTHKDNIDALNAKQDILDYDITTGWP